MKVEGIEFPGINVEDRTIGGVYCPTVKCECGWKVHARVEGHDSYERKLMFHASQCPEAKAS